MDHYIILGNHNFGLSLVLENLAAQFGGHLKVDIVTIFTDEENKLARHPYDVPLFETTKVHYTDWKPDPGFSNYLNCGMSGESRSFIYEFFAKKFGVKRSQYGCSIHPSAAVASTAEIGAGVYIGPQCTVGPYVNLGDFCFMNRNSNVGHHMTLDDFVIVGSGASIASQVYIGKQSYIGVGATILEKINIGENTRIGAGAVVTKDIPANKVAYGVPAKVKRDNT